MSSGRAKGEVITFKVDETLADALAGISNRSDFIRSAILSALGNVCPLCNGTGTLSASQRHHWDEFSRQHHVHVCDECNEAYLVCEHEKPGD